ncbi:MAG TPA: DUF1045 domain-containing protein [Hyphomicrobiales bacterium]|jgi:hypothetical protein
MQYERYAIYWAPAAESGLSALACSWFGGDLENGKASLDRNFLGLGPDLAESAVTSPRRYGLHATMKAPFRLAPNSNAATLGDSLAAFCARRRRIRTGPLRLTRFSRFLALVPQPPRAELDWLADECTTWFDRFRAPLSDADRDRRSGSLTSLETAQLEEFGYPYIFSSFMFHITLAGPLGDADLDRVEAALATAVAPFTEADFAIDELCLFGDPGDGAMFRLLGRYPLAR